MRALIRLMSLTTTLALVAIASVANATHEPPQIIEELGGADDTLVGIDSSGVATAVWTEDGVPRYAMRTAGGRFGVAVPLVEDRLASVVALDVSDNGNAIVAWTDISGEGDVRAAVRIGDRGFTPPRILSGPMGSNNPFSPDVAINDAGRSVVVWEQRGADPASINAAFGNGSTFGPAEAIVTDAAVIDPRVEIDGTGRALAVWDYDTQSDDQIQGATAPAGDTFGTMFTIENLDQGAGTPELAVNESGDAVLAYEDAVPDDSSCTSCSIFRVETRYGSVDGTFGPVQPTPLNDESGYGPGQHEVAIDDSGAAALLLSISSPQGRVLARTSDTAGTFGALQTVSAADALFGPGIGNVNMDIDAGGGEFTAVWINDHDGDGDSNEVYQASTSGGTFGEVHPLSMPSEDFPTGATVGRDDSGRTVALWYSFVTNIGNAPQATPVGTKPALTEGTTAGDNLTGTSGPDRALLEGGNDIFNGGGGNDLIFGGAGNDNLKGGAGADQIRGEAGKDKLIGGPGIDVMNGGSGRDTCSGTNKEKRKAISCETWLPITV